MSDRSVPRDSGPGAGADFRSVGDVIVDKSKPTVIWISAPVVPSLSVPEHKLGARH
jgi:hypothetical protein